MAILILLLMLSPWAYTLEDQNEPELLALRTQYGTYRVLRSEDWGCAYVLANQNVQIVDWQQNSLTVIPDGEGWLPACQMTAVAHMDEIPCWMNPAGDCDVRIENAG